MSFLITRAIDNNVVSGKLAVAGVKGQLVAVKNPTTAATGVFEAAEFELATGKRGYVLERDVLNASSIPLEQLIWNDSIKTPALINQHVTARQIIEGEFEGADFVQSTGAQLINASTPINSPLTTLAGRWALLTGDQKELAASGRNGAGAVTLTGARVGDVVRQVVNLAGGSAGGSFESTITVADQIQQTSGSDLSAVSYLFIVETPGTGQQLAGYLRGLIASQDGGSDPRILVETVN